MIAKRKRSTYWFGSLVALFTAATLTLSACGAATTSAPAQNANNSSATAASGANPASSRTDTLIIAQGVDATTMDPNFNAETTTANILRAIYDPLMTRDKDEKLQPWLVTEWKNINPTTWEFKLRNDVKFSDGTPLTADDVKYTFDRILNPANKSPQITNVDMIKEVDVKDPYTFDIVTKAPYPLLPSRIAGTSIVSKKYAEEHGMDYMAQHPMGSGPYVLKDWKRDSEVDLDARSDYWGGKPAYAHVIWKAIPETSTRIADLQTGAVDIAVNIPPDQAKIIDSKSFLTAASVPSGRTVFIVVPTTGSGPLSNKLVRQALNYAVDKNAIVQSLLMGYGYPLDGQMMTKQSFGYDPSLKMYPYDPNKAKDLLKQAGYPNGFSITLYTPDGRYMMDKEIAQAVRGQLEAIGIKVDLKVTEWGTYVKKIFAHDLGDSLWLIGWGNSTFDADGTLYSWLQSKSVYSYVNDPTIDQELEAARSEMDQNKRLAEYQDIDKKVYDMAPFIFLHQQKDIYGVNKRVDWQPRSDELIDVREMKPASGN